VTGTTSRIIMVIYNKKLKYFSRKLRNTLTDSELLLWSYLRRKQIMEIQFYRQKIIGNYIVDFYAPSVRLVIEVDGSQHYGEEGIKKDSLRDAYLSSLNIYTLRFNNYQVITDIENVLDEIFEYVEKYFQNPLALRAPPF
jgi:very-short-patch-repair endonuclease